MKLSISTCATERKILPKGFAFEPVEGIRQCRDAGFEYVDFNFTQAACHGRPLSQENWEEWGDTIAAAVTDSGLIVEQTHGHWFHLSDIRSQEELDWNEEMVRRSILCSSKLGDRPWMVIHPYSIFDSGIFDLQKSREYNYAVCMRLGELASKCGVRIAVENLFSNRKIGYCCKAEELAELMERLHSDIFGICWDFGHANRCRLHHLEALDIVAPHLAVVHCHDNKAFTDDHFIPYFGTVPWKDILPKLKHIGYNGNLNMEVHVFYNTLPQSLRMEGLAFMRRVGEDMIKLYDEA